MIGEQISHYKIEAKLGAGGMGVVYKARDLELDRTVALKFLPPHLSQADEERKRFIREAKAASGLDHPNICIIHEIGKKEDGQLFIAMAYYDGASLKERIDAGALTEEDALDIARQIAEGLEKAHNQDIVHRDIKPANILLTREGQVKIVDFGLAKLATESVLTKEGTTLGTAAYMSPEQTRGEEVDARADIWALGVILYEMLTGKRPFAGEYEQAIIFSILNEEPKALADLKPGVNPKLQSLVMKLLSKDPLERFQNLAEVKTALADLQAPPSQSPGPTTRFNARARRPKSVLYLGLIPILLLLIWAGYQLIGPADRSLDSIAVLPLRNTSGDPEQAYFVDGMTEELINALGRVGGLRVAARTSSFSFKDKILDIRDIGEKLQVATLLEGSVRKSGRQIRVNVQLISVHDGYQLWSQTYERDIQDVFVVQNDISQSIATALQVQLVGDESVRVHEGEVDLAAYEHFLKGRHFWYRRTQEALMMAVDHFDQAIAAAPEYAKAYAGLADAYCILGFYDWLAPADAFPKAREAAERALELDGSMAETHAALGYIALYYDWDGKASDRAFQRCIALNPQYPIGYQWYANLFVATGRFQEAAAAFQKGIDLDPLALVTRAAKGWAYYFDGEDRRAIEVYNRTLELDSTFVLAHFWMGQAYETSGTLDLAIAKIRHAIRLTSGSPIMELGLAHALARMGQVQEAQTIVDQFEINEQNRYVPAYEMAKAYLALDRQTEAYAWFEKAYNQRSHSLVFLNVDPQLKPYRSDPQFQLLLDKVGFVR